MRTAVALMLVLGVTGCQKETPEAAIRAVLADGVAAIGDGLAVPGFGG